MTDALPPEEEADALAAELALGLLDDDERALAERREASDPFFAARVAAWHERMQPMLEALPSREPPAHLWDRIDAAIGPVAANDDDGVDRVVRLKRTVGRWRGYSAAMTALAACLAIVVGIDVARQQPVTSPALPPPAAAPAAEPLLVAALAPEGGPVGATATFDSARADLVVTRASLDLQDGRDPELWIVPGSGDPRSLGVLGGGSARIPLAPELAVLLRDSGTLAISSEPRGGSPTGLPTGPIVAAGKLEQI